MGGLEWGQFIRPGEGLNVEKRSLGGTRESLKNGSYNVASSEGQVVVRGSLSCDDGNKGRDIYALTIVENKLYRNAYASLVLDSIWQGHHDFVLGKERGVFGIKYDAKDRTSLVPVSHENAERMSFRQMADAIADSNQAVLIHLICEEFRDGKVPAISGDEKKDKEYFDGFKEQTDLEMRALGEFFTMIPNEFGSPSRFITAGLLVPRNIIFATPNLIDDISARQRIVLDSDQHRRAVSNSLKQMSHYFLPTIPLAIDLLNRFVDFETGKLKVETWESRGGPDDFVVVPGQDMVESANSSMKGVGLPVQTGCPALVSKVAIDGGKSKPFPRYLTDTVLMQLDALYYPKRKKEKQGLIDVFVASSNEYLSKPYKYLKDDSVDLKDVCQIM